MISLRAATLADCERVFEWNFAPDVRAMSGDPTVVEFAHHAAWFAKRVVQPAMWIVENDNCAVGVVRIDAGRISIALAASARGHGIGKQAIAAACAAWGGPVVAQVRNNNIASRACFEACGFVANGAAEVVTYEWSP